MEPKCGATRRGGVACGRGERNCPSPGAGAQIPRRVLRGRCTLQGAAQSGRAGVGESCRGECILLWRQPPRMGLELGGTVRALPTSATVESHVMREDIRVAVGDAAMYIPLPAGAQVPGRGSARILPRLGERSAFVLWSTRTKLRGGGMSGWAGASELTRWGAQNRPESGLSATSSDRSRNTGRYTPSAGEHPPQIARCGKENSPGGGCFLSLIHGIVRN
ncbi:hypothetical protein C2E23DRAFT_831620 [Lenzites betulinus]|nr:hypothetical protein C2E23DRAFT_831608 [Lenzites betulinus]KAH9851244.1 hypothetical protein C2E23DRAFT_831620 [Lenzites betulinus]